MRDLLAERTRVKNAKPPREKSFVTSVNGNGASGSGNGGNGIAGTGRGEKDLNALVESVKRKMDQGVGAKRKRSRK